MEQPSGNSDVNNYHVMVDGQHVPPSSPPVAAAYAPFRYDLRHRHAVGASEPVVIESPVRVAPQPLPAPNTWQRVLEYVMPRQVRVVKDNDPMAWKPYANRAHTGSMRRVAYVGCALLALLAGVLGVALLFDWTNAKYESRSMHTVQLLDAIFDGTGMASRENRLEAVKLAKNGTTVVYNVLEVAHGVETVADVIAVFRKLRLINGSVHSVSSSALADGYVSYAHEQPRDSDADLVYVNATLDALEAVMLRETPTSDVCAGFVHFGVEYNGMLLVREGSSEETSREAEFMYNVRVDEVSAEQFDEPVSVECRLQRALGRTDGRTQVKRVPLTVSIEYTARADKAGKWRRKKLTEAREIACILNVLRLGGLYTKEA